MTMACLLVAAFLATNVLSLVYMLTIAVGMAARPAPRRRAWRFVFVPLLGLVLLFQYTILIWYGLCVLSGSYDMLPSFASCSVCLS